MFDTLLVKDGRPVALERHLARLAASVAELYGATLPTTLAAGVQAAAAEAAAARPRPAANRRRTRRGRQDHDLAGEGCAPSSPLLLEPFALPGGLGDHKWRDRRLLDALTALHPGTVPLLVDTDGLVLEAAYSNVWIVEGDALITPPADGRILPGTTRAALLAAEPAAREEPIDLERLASADSVFLSSSINDRLPARVRSPARSTVPAAAPL